MNKFTKIIATVLSVILSTSTLAIVGCASDEIDYTIIDPYETVDWDTWEYYKANLHTHSTYSDGRITLPDMVEKYYDLGYDILAMTDHGVINNGWNQSRKYYPPFNLLQKTEQMSDEDYIRITTGADRDGRGMTDITGGIEINMAVISKTHVNAYFTETGSGDWGIENDYETAVKKVHNSGKGYTVLNHVGDWVNSNAYPERSHDPEYIAYFATILTKYDSCLGMEIINNTDTVTQADKALWDELLQVVIPTGRNIIAFADDDSEYESDIGNSFEMFVLPENNEEEVKTAMVNGTFFACSRFAKIDIGPNFEGTGDVPLVTSVTVNQEDNTISLTLDETRDCTSVEWIADGNIIAEGTEIDLNDYEDELGCYIRFQLKGEGGITYSQAFELQYEGRVDKEIPDNMEKYDTFFGKIAKRLIQTRAFAIIMFIAEKIEIALK